MDSANLKGFLTKWVAEKSANGISQHSEKWHEARKFTIGGSSMPTIQGVNPFTNIRSLISQRIGLSKFVSSIQPQWGNLFEEIIKRVVEKEMNCEILGEDLFIEGPNGLTYSPDGLAVVARPAFNSVAGGFSDDSPLSSFTSEECIALFEFKCPFSRIPGSYVPKYYVPQVKMGLEIIDIANHGVFVEGVFRRCSLGDLGYNEKYDKTLVAKSAGLMPLAFGFIIFSLHSQEMRSSPELIEAARFLETIDGFTDETNSPVDLGAAPVPFFTRIMDLYDKKVLTVRYSSEFRANEDYTSELNQMKCAEARDGKRIIGVLPWKLFKLYYNTIYPEKDYMQPWMPKIKEILDVIKECNESENSQKKESILNSFITDSPFEIKFAESRRKFSGFSDD